MSLQIYWLDFYYEKIIRVSIYINRNIIPYCNTFVTKHIDSLIQK